MAGAVADKVMKTCAKCKKSMDQKTNYYKYKNGTYHDFCKKCFTMHMNVRETSTIIPMLEELDLPFIEHEWTSLVDKYADNPKTTSTAIFGRYVAKMKLSQFSQYSFKDTGKFVEDARMRELKERAEKFARINKYREAKDSGDIPDELKDVDLSVLDEKELIDLIGAENINSLSLNPEGSLTSPVVSLIDSLTHEDKIYLFTKWGKTYTINECIRLEKLYNEMLESYDIRTASHKDYLLKICRVSLKIDQSLEVNDVDGFHKMSRVYDLLMKSAKFTAGSNKNENDDNSESVSYLVSICEEEGFIEKYYTERPDIVDITLNDNKAYLNKLVMNEMNLGNMIELHLQKMLQEQDKEEDEMDEDDDIVIVSQEEEVDLTTEDYEDFGEMVEEEIELTEELLKKSGDNLYD